MKTNVHSNSLAAIWSMRDSGELPEKERIVYRALEAHGRMTREQLAHVTGMKESSVCGRVFTLKERGMVVGVATAINPVTKALNEIVDINPLRKAMRQVELELECA